MDFSNEGTYRAFPLQKNQILVRFENLADRFDKHSTSNWFVNIENFAGQLYTEVNDRLPKSVTVDEMSLSGNQLKSTLDNNKFIWRGMGDDDATMNKFEVLAATDRANSAGIIFSPQRIRQFRITYNN